MSGVTEPRIHPSSIARTTPLLDGQGLLESRAEAPPRQDDAPTSKGLVVRAGRPAFVEPRTPASLGGRRPIHTQLSEACPRGARGLPSMNIDGQAARRR